MKPGVWQLLIVLLIVLVLFGPKNLPKLGDALGKTIGKFKKGLNEEDEKPAAEEAKAVDKSGEE